MSPGSEARRAVLRFKHVHMGTSHHRFGASSWNTGNARPGDVTERSRTPPRTLGQVGSRYRHLCEQVERRPRAREICQHVATRGKGHSADEDREPESGEIVLD